MPLSQILGTLPETSNEQVQSVLRAVRRHLGMDVGFISEFVGGDRVFRFSDGEVTRNPIHVGASSPLEAVMNRRPAKSLILLGRYAGLF